MSAARAPMAPPDLPGFRYLDVLGSGGFADVFLYEQELPRRNVAVKVLLTDRISSSSVQEFTDEANVMAMLSTHPAIVTIYQAGVSRDGRPYLVMEYCPKPNLQARYRREAFSVAESLRVGIQVAAAVETAHRAGVLHRDIKPANILVTEYNRPALTDFGIASTSGAAGESAGLSIPWSPPESFADTPRSDARSDVYALGATVYSLLAGRSPFELPGQRNSGVDLIERIETLPLPAIGRADIPSSLQYALERSMAKNPADRYESALAFARALQTVQIELAHSVTPIDILDDGVPDEIEEDEDDGRTRVRGVMSINPETTPAAGHTRPSALTTPVSRPAPAVDQTVRRGPAGVPAFTEQAEQTVRRDAAPTAAPAASDATVVRPPVSVSPTPSMFETAAPAVVEPESAERAPRRRGLMWVLIAGAAVIVIAGIVVVASLLNGGEPAAKPSSSATAQPQDPLSGYVAAPTDLKGTVGPNGVTFTWTNPEPHKGDTYLWGVTVPGQDTELAQTDKTTVTVPADPTGRTCITVSVKHPDGTGSADTTGCAQ
ncbi:serine/threonine-protein kinase [Microbacterium sp. ASV49]|uniref:non-specific serine/threonine protein kinase n=1 Tax=Microbacterium candidum TaxID=3041922 RepID=A0ABT7MUS5_9MICO|nr:serine/threonine-protein kinase [Microbacterium sp. ASV49]MDL9978204.1 protein kinase [Microbacterium sp. ASV49]